MVGLPARGKHYTARRIVIEIRVMTPTSRGESYQDITLRLDSVVIQLERTRKAGAGDRPQRGAAQHYISPLMTPPPQPLVLSA